MAKDDDLASLGAAIESTGAAAADGRLADAARAFAPFVLTDAEFAALDGDFFERWGGSIPAMPVLPAEPVQGGAVAIRP